MEKKVAIVTGGSKGIGAAIVKQLVTDGFAVAIGERDLASANQYAQQFPAGTVKAYAADVSDRAAVFALVKQTVADFGRLDVMVNNAGISMEKSLLEMSEEEMDRLYAVNEKGVLWGIQAASSLSPSRRRVRSSTLARSAATRSNRATPATRQPSSPSAR